MSETTSEQENFGLTSSAEMSPMRGTIGDSHTHHEAENIPNHLALLYEDRNDQFAAVVPFLRQGLERGERCLYIATDNSKHDILAELQASDIDIDAAIESGAFTVLTPEETYLATGSFDGEAMLDFWKEALAHVQEGGDYTGVRACAEMSWALDTETGAHELASYESMLNDLYAGKDYVVLCQYNRERFPSNVLSDVIHTHPLVVHDETLHQNKQFCPPDEFQNAGLSTLDIDHYLGQLTGPNTPRTTPTSGVDDREPDNPRVLPLVSDPGNRRVLIESLTEDYDVVPVGESSAALYQESFDLCIMDPASFEQAREVLIDYKEAQSPRILPYLLIRQEDTPLLNGDALQYIDDMVVMPTSTHEFTNRIESLLQLRSLSLELDQKNDQLRQKNEQLEYLVGAAAHDLRNPLNIAQGYLEELDDSEPVRYVSNALDRMEHLVEDLLTMHRTGQDEVEKKLETVELSSIISECYEFVPMRGAGLENEIPDEVRIRAWPELLRQLVENLLRNAVEHCDGMVSIRVGMLPEGDGFYVADNGTGIPDEERESVFEEGYSTSKGNGLGLAIVKRVVESHGWGVEITESESGGARFEFRRVELREQTERSSAAFAP